MQRDRRKPPRASTNRVAIRRVQSAVRERIAAFYRKVSDDCDGFKTTNSDGRAYKSAGRKKKPLLIDQQDRSKPVRVVLSNRPFSRRLNRNTRRHLTVVGSFFRARFDSTRVAPRLRDKISAGWRINYPTFFFCFVSTRSLLLLNFIWLQSLLFHLCSRTRRINNQVFTLYSFSFSLL